MMELFAAVQTRSSAARVGEPGPSREDLELLLQAAARAPDHGRLKPWRFIVLDGATREAFTAAAAEAKRARLPAMTAEQLAAEREKFNRSPTIVVVGYGVMWKTGAAAYDPAVKATVGLRPDDHIVAIMHLGARLK